MNTLPKRAGFAAIALVASARALSCPWAVPAGLHGVDVAQSLVVNGLPMAVTQVEGREPAAELLDRTEKAWKEAGYAVKRSQAAGWEIVSALSEQCLATLQLTPRNGAFGYLAISRPARSTAPTLASFGLALPASVTVGSQVASDDGGRRGLTLALRSDRPLDELSRHFMEDLARRDWSGIRPHRVVHGPSGKASQLIQAQRGRQQVQLMLWSEGGTQALMTLSDSL